MYGWSRPTAPAKITISKFKLITWLKLIFSNQPEFILSLKKKQTKKQKQQNAFEISLTRRNKLNKLLSRIR